MPGLDGYPGGQPATGPQERPTAYHDLGIDRVARGAVHVASVVGRNLLGGGLLPTQANPSSHAVRDPEAPGGVRLHEESDAHVHSWDVTQSDLPGDWLEAKRLG